MKQKGVRQNNCKKSIQFAIAFQYPLSKTCVRSSLFSIDMSYGLNCAPHIYVDH